MTMFKKDNKYYNYMFSSSLLNEYKKIDDDISICCNYEITNEDLKLNYLEKNTFKEIGIIPLCIKNLFKYYKVNTKIIEQVVKENDKIIIRSPSFISFKAKKICKKYKKKYIIEMVGCPFDAFWNHSFKGKLIAIPFYLKTRSLIKDSENVIYVTNQFLQKRYPTKGAMFACSDVEIGNTDNSILRTLENKDKINLCTIASLDVKYKGQKYVIEALSKMNNKDYQLHYYLIGQGEGKMLQHLILKKNLEDRVHIIGSLSHDEVLQFLDKIDIYIQPSLTEGLPRTMIEAMSKAVSVIGSDIGGIPELVPEEGCFKKKNVQSIIEKIQFLLDENIYLKESERSLFVAKTYSKDKLQYKRKNIYESIFSEVKYEKNTANR